MDSGWPRPIFSCVAPANWWATGNTACRPCGWPTWPAIGRFWSRPAADAQALLAADPGLAAPEHQLLRRMVLARYGRSLSLGDVG